MSCDTLYDDSCKSEFLKEVFLHEFKFKVGIRRLLPLSRVVIEFSVVSVALGSVGPELIMHALGAAPTTLFCTS